MTPTPPTSLKQVAPLASLGWGRYLDQLDRCDGIAAFDGTPLSPLPSELINSGEWEWQRGGISFHVNYSRDEETFPAYQPAGMGARLLFIGVATALIAGFWWYAVLVLGNIWKAAR